MKVWATLGSLASLAMLIVLTTGLPGRIPSLPASAMDTVPAGLGSEPSGPTDRTLATPARTRRGSTRPAAQGEAQVPGAMRPTTQLPGNAAAAGPVSNLPPGEAFVVLPRDFIFAPRELNTITVRSICELDELAVSVTIALQRCIDNAPPDAAVEIPRGVYYLDRQVIISKSLTLRTEGSAAGGVTCTSGPDGCARLTAAPGLLDEYGMLLVRSTSNVTLEHIVVDGNRSARLTLPAASACRTGRNVVGFNATVSGCTMCALRDFVSMNALCGTGLLWVGGQATIEHSDFRSNGQVGTPGLWADGLTAISAPDSVIRENRFIDNSDIGLILGYAPRSRIERNQIIQRERDMFAGIMLDNFTSNDLQRLGDFRQAVVTNNTVDCRPQFCLFGIQVGPRPWPSTGNIAGGVIYDNRVHGAKIGINVDGAGIVGAPVAIYSNRVTDVPAGRFVNCSTSITTGWMNIAPTSIVDRGDEVRPTGTSLSDSCQLGSPLTATGAQAD